MPQASIHPMPVRCDFLLVGFGDVSAAAALPTNASCDSPPTVWFDTSSEEHQALDWEGIHAKICAILTPLRAGAPVIGSEEEREKRTDALKASKRALVELTRNEASKYLVAGQFELAVRARARAPLQHSKSLLDLCSSNHHARPTTQQIPGAVQSLRFSTQVFGDGAIEIVHAYLLLAEANLGLRRYKQTEEFLGMANWSVLKNPDCR